MSFPDWRVGVAADAAGTATSAAARARTGRKRFTRSPPVGLDLGPENLPRNAQRFTGELLEMSDQLLASAHQPAVLEAPGGHAAVDALDEHPVLLADLVVEGHQLVDPRLVDVGPEEVVQETVGAVGRERHHRADRDVRLPRKDVDAEVRPEEVELGARQLAVEVHRRAAAGPGG